MSVLKIKNSQGEDGCELNCERRNRNVFRQLRFHKC